MIGGAGSVSSISSCRPQRRFTMCLRPLGRQRTRRAQTSKRNVPAELFQEQIHTVKIDDGMTHELIGAGIDDQIRGKSVDLDGYDHLVQWLVMHGHGFVSRYPDLSNSFGRATNRSDAIATRAKTIPQRKCFDIDSSFACQAVAQRSRVIRQPCRSAAKAGASFFWISVTFPLGNR